MVALDRLVALYPGLGAELRVRQMGGPPAPAPPAPAPPLSQAAAPPPRPPESRDGADALRLLRVFVESYLGEGPQLRPDELGAVLDHVAGVLETFARSFLELRRGHEEFGAEMGIRTARGEGAIYRARDASRLLTYVLDPSAEGREQELQRAFADFMLHQVALLRGATEGAHALLERLAPEGIAAQVPKGIWPMRAAALWKAFEEAFHEIADEEDALSSVLFGQEFARAYSAIAGGRAAQAQDSEDDEPPAGRRPAR
jgi:type VI secretion system protein